MRASGLFASWARSRPCGQRSPGQWLGGGRLRANSGVNGGGPAPCGPHHSLPLAPGSGRGPPTSAPSTAIHHLDPWRALTAALAALTRLTKQFATSHLLDRLLARPQLKQPSPPLHTHPSPPNPCMGQLPALFPPSDHRLLALVLKILLCPTGFSTQ